MLKIDIYSDVKYDYYQHVNHMIFDYFNGKDQNIRFLEKFYMNYRVPKFFVKKNGNSTFNSKGIKKNVINIKNLPSFCYFTDILNYILVNQQINNVGDRVAITFLPSKALDNIFNKYKSLIYYCVHDSNNQAYNKRNLAYEIELIEKAKFVFCDNEVVLNRFCSPRNDVFYDLSKIRKSELINNKKKFFYIPPPVQSEFYKIDKGKEKYDFVFFGSIHKNIDLDVISKLIEKKYSINIISNDIFQFKSKYISYTKATSDIKQLVSYLSESRSILLPYDNSDFMSTVSPAKINQSLATGKKTYCSNNKICEKYNIFHTDSIYDHEYEHVHEIKNVSIYSEVKIMEKIKILLEQ